MKVVLTALLIVVGSGLTFAQRSVDEDSNFEDRIYAGFGLGGLSWGRDTYNGQYFSIGVSGLTGYMITNNLSMGVGVEYTYTNYSDLDFKDHVYGGYPFIRYNIKQFFLQADYDLYSLQVNFSDESREIFERFFIGGGYFSPPFNALIQYDFLYSNTSRFSSPLSIRVFFTFPN